MSLKYILEQLSEISKLWATGEIDDLEYLEDMYNFLSNVHPVSLKGKRLVESKLRAVGHELSAYHDWMRMSGVEEGLV